MRETLPIILHTVAWAAGALFQVPIDGSQLSLQDPPEAQRDAGEARVGRAAGQQLDQPGRGQPVVEPMDEATHEAAAGTAGSGSGSGLRMAAMTSSAVRHRVPSSLGRRSSWRGSSTGVKATMRVPRRKPSTAVVQPHWMRQSHAMSQGTTFPHGRRRRLRTLRGAFARSRGSQRGGASPRSVDRGTPRATAGMSTWKASNTARL